jgi:hypothetical protein
MQVSPISALLRKRIEADHDVYVVVNRYANFTVGIFSTRHLAEREKARLNAMGYDCIVTPWYLDRSVYA